MKWNLSLLIPLFLGGCAGFNGNIEPHPGRGGLEGIWEVCFMVHESGPTVQGPRTVAGYITLMPMVNATRPWMYLGEPTHYGVYTTDLARIGITRDPRIPLPLVGARAGRDTVSLVFDPFGSHGPVIIRGKLSPDAASGIWYHQTYAFGVEGRFSMKRLAVNTLPVPYPFEGPLTPPGLAGCSPTGIDE